MNVDVLHECCKIENRVGLTPYLLQIGDQGIEKTLKESRSLARGVYLYRGSLTKINMAERFGLSYKELSPG